MSRGLSFIALLLGLLGSVWAQEPVSWNGLRPTAPLGTDIQLTDQHGRPFRLSEVPPGLTLLAFGYTHCPDVCPDTLAVLQRVADGLPAHRRPRRLFVTLDPERDRPAVLREYLAWFDEGIVGLTGSAERLAPVYEAYRVAVERHPGGAIAHSAYLYLLDPHGQVLLMYPYGTDAHALMADIDALHRLIRSRGAER